MSIKIIFENKSKFKLNIKKNFEKKKETEELIGNKKDDFIPLKVIKDYNYQIILKVKSKINNKIYMMKIYKKEIKKMENEEKVKYPKIEILFLRKLIHKNIIKYYKDFEDNQNYYIIIEYIDCPNLKDFFNSDKFNNCLKEKIIKKLLYQCFNVLIYIHNEGICKRNIKYENILIDDNYNIKIVDFSSSAILNEYFKEKYSENIKDKNETFYLINNGIKQLKEEDEKEKIKNDIYSLGLIFENILNKEENIYSQELKKIINELKNENNQKTSYEIYEKLNKEFYINKYSSIFSCLLSIFNFEEMNKINEIKEINKEQKKVTKFFVDTFNYYRNNYNFDKKIFNFKQENLKLIWENGDENLEIKPLSFLKFLLGKLNEELNTSKIIQRNEISINNNDIRELSYHKDIISFNNFFESFIGNYFFGIFKLKRMAEECIVYFYNRFNIISFNKEYLIEKLINDNKKINFENVFKLYKDEYIKRKINCNCKSNSKHYEYFSIFKLPKILIFNFDTKKNNCFSKIDFPEQIEFDKNYIEELTNNQEEKKLFNLYSIICKIEDDEGKEMYICFTKKKIKDKKNNYYDLDHIKNNYNIINLFYYNNNQKNNDILDINNFELNVCNQIKEYFEENFEETNPNYYSKYKNIINDIKNNKENINILCKRNKSNNNDKNKNNINKKNKNNFLNTFKNNIHINNINKENDNKKKYKPNIKGGLSGEINERKNINLIPISIFNDNSNNFNSKNNLYNNNYINNNINNNYNNNLNNNNYLNNNNNINNNFNNNIINNQNFYYNNYNYLNRMNIFNNFNYRNEPNRINNYHRNNSSKAINNINIYYNRRNINIRRNNSFYKFFNHRNINIIGHNINNNNYNNNNNKFYNNINNMNNTRRNCNNYFNNNNKQDFFNNINNNK